MASAARGRRPSSVATPAVGAAAPGPVDDAWVHVDGDMVVPAALAAEPGARAEGEGYLTSPSMTGNLGSYDIRLVDSSGVESVRPEVEEAAARGRTTPPAATCASSPGVTEDVEDPARGRDPGRRHVLVAVLGVAVDRLRRRADDDRARPRTSIATSGKVWLHPDVLDLDARTTASTSCPTSSATRSASGTTTGAHDGEVAGHAPVVVRRAVVPVRRPRRAALPARRRTVGPVQRPLRLAVPCSPRRCPRMASGTTTGAGREPGEPLHAGRVRRGVGVALVDGARRASEVTAEIVAATFDTVRRRVPRHVARRAHRGGVERRRPGQQPAQRGPVRGDGRGHLPHRDRRRGRRARARSRSASGRGRSDRSAPTSPSRSGSTATSSGPAVRPSPSCSPRSRRCSRANGPPPT